MLCLHKWSKWSLPYSISVRMPCGSFGDTYEKEISVQERGCLRCGRVQVREIVGGVADGVEIVGLEWDSGETEND